MFSKRTQTVVMDGSGRMQRVCHQRHNDHGNQDQFNEKVFHGSTSASGSIVEASGSLRHFHSYYEAFWALCNATFSWRKRHLIVAASSYSNCENALAHLIPQDSATAH
jgi:hypothetical protein